MFLLPNLLILVSLFVNYGNALGLKLHCDSPIVKGATLNCTTGVYNDDGKTLAEGTFRYSWRDDAIPPNSREVDSGPSVDTWLITYNNTWNKPGYYVMRVEVCEREFIGWICRHIDPIGTFFIISDTLNGDIELHQAKDTRDAFVSTSGTLKSTISLKKSDHDYLSKAPTVLFYWFVDQLYLGFTADFQFEFNFTKPDEDHVIETIVIGDFKPLPPPTTVPPLTSTRTKSTTTTQAPTTKVTSTTPKSTGSAAKVYGFFRKNFTTKAPISNVTVSGNNRLQHGDLLSLKVKCLGSNKMRYCVMFKHGKYHTTGNETCPRYDDLDHCDFPIKRYFRGTLSKHTVVIIIKNDVSKKITPVTVTVYKDKQKPQLEEKSH